MWRSRPRLCQNASMDDQLPPPERFALAATLFEATLAILAVAIGWLVGHPPAATFQPSGAALAWGLAATVPALGLLWTCLQCPWGSLARLARLTDRQLVPLFRRSTLVELAAISLVAGIGEEMLFRGLIQGGVADWIGGPAGFWIGLAAGSLAFGMAHPLSITYVLLTGLVGLYLGWLWTATGNLLAPITTHAAYDFLALLYLARIRRPLADCSDHTAFDDHEGGERNANY
jgi:uncharacterized protein